MSRHETSLEFKQDYYIGISPIVEMTLIVRLLVQTMISMCLFNLN